ncbi:hypothetical protein P3G55_25630, partial [Leptospira sp. 96542]|nr:hypothetical protein [Leptospira sp. 96542]
LLDKLRRHELQPNPLMVDVLLESADASRLLLARHQTGDTSDPPSTAGLVQRISELASGGMPMAAEPPVEVVPVAVAPVPVAPQPVAAVPVAKAAKTSFSRLLEIRLGPLERSEQADGVKDLFRDIAGLGRIAEVASDKPEIRVFKVRTTSADDELLDLFVFHVSREQVQIEQLPEEAGSVGWLDLEDPPAGAPVAPAPGYGFFENAPGGFNTMPAAAPAKAPATAPAAAARPAGGGNAPAAAHAAQPEAATIRVAISKVDQLINLVGELVITQAMLAQNSQALDPAVNQQLLAGLADLDRNTRDLQESV